VTVLRLVTTDAPMNGYKRLRTLLIIDGERAVSFKTAPAPEEITEAEAEVSRLEHMVRTLRTPLSVVQKLKEASTRLKELRFARAFFHDKAPHGAKLAALNARNKAFWEGDKR
jgi:hypothetical protein